MNDLKGLRNIDRRTSPSRGKMFRESSIEIKDASFLDNSLHKAVPARHSSPEQVRGHNMRGLLEYSHALPYRDQVIITFAKHFSKKSYLEGDSKMWSCQGC